MKSFFRKNGWWGWAELPVPGLYETKRKTRIYSGSYSLQRGFLDPRISLCGFSKHCFEFYCFHVTAEIHFKQSLKSKLWKWNFSILMHKTPENIWVNINGFDKVFTPTVRFNGKHELKNISKKKKPFHMVLRNLYYYTLTKLFNEMTGWVKNQPERKKFPKMPKDMV